VPTSCYLPGMQARGVHGHVTFNTHAPGWSRANAVSEPANQLLGDSRRPINKVFATIDNDERWPFLQRSTQGWQDIVCLYR